MLRIIWIHIFFVNFCIFAQPSIERLQNEASYLEARQMGLIVEAYRLAYACLIRMRAPQQQLKECTQQWNAIALSARKRSELVRFSFEYPEYTMEDLVRRVRDGISNLETYEFEALKRQAELDALGFFLSDEDY